MPHPNRADDPTGLVVVGPPELAGPTWALLGGAATHRRLPIATILSEPAATIRGLGAARDIRHAVLCTGAAAERGLLDALADLGATHTVAPARDELLRPGRPIGPPAAIDAAELIGRPARPIDQALIGDMVRGARVLITGAGGSIGAELARICARFEPASLILMDRAENALFDIEREIASRHPTAPRCAVLHDVVDADATLRRFLDLRPDVVLHAAAHKHVPLMEDHPAAAVENNVFGTKSVADAALASGADRMVMISTDKAVHPTSVMGATKRLAEHYVRSRNGTGQTRFGLVRFGNVLGSACSVLPVWASQLAAGGPVTVTHPAMTRYFMTIPEAAALVLQAGAMIGGDAHGDVFVLDMGPPVRVLDLARRFIEAHGLIPAMHGEPALANVDERLIARIVLSGIRPGEKLFEELSYEAEELAPTPVRGVLAWCGPPPDAGAVARMIAELSALRTCQSQGPVVEALRRHVPEMGPAALVPVTKGTQPRSGASHTEAA